MTSNLCVTEPESEGESSFVKVERNADPGSTITCTCPSTDQSQRFCWASTYQANDPCEDRYASLTNVLLQCAELDHQPSQTPKSLPLEKYPEMRDEHDNSHSDSALCSCEAIMNRSSMTSDDDRKVTSDTINPEDIETTPSAFIRMSFFMVLDGHGGHSVAELASQKLLPLLCTNIARVLGYNVHNHGEFRFNGNKGEWDSATYFNESLKNATEHTDLRKALPTKWYKSALDSTTSPTFDKKASSESCKDSSSQPIPKGTPSSSQESRIRQTIQDTFLQFDEDMINSIDTHQSHQTQCIKDGEWNVGSCCLVNIVLQNLASIEVVSNRSATLYTAHVGDCRAILMRSKDVSKISSASSDSSESDSEFFADDNSSIDSDCFIDGDDSNATFQNYQLQSVGRHGKHQRVPTSLDACSRTIHESTPIGKNEHRPMKFWSSASEEQQYRLQDLEVITLTEDHTPYNSREALLVRTRSKYAPNAICPSLTGGIERAGGSLSVTRSLGDAYLKTPVLSFQPFKDHAPYITAIPDVSVRDLQAGSDHFLMLGSDGVWELSNENDILKWITNFCRSSTNEYRDRTLGQDMGSSNMKTSTETIHRRKKRKKLSDQSPTISKKMRHQSLCRSKITDVIIARVLMRISRKQRGMKSIRSLMSTKPGMSRRSKHDDITAVVVDLSGFIQ